MAIGDLERVEQEPEHLDVQTKRMVADELAALSLPEFSNDLTDIICSAGQYVDGHRDEKSFKEMVLDKFNHIKRHYDKILPLENYTSRWLQPLVKVRSLLPKMRSAIEAILNSSAQDKGEVEKLYQNLNDVVQDITKFGLMHAANIQRLSEDVRRCPGHEKYKPIIPNNTTERGYT